MIKSDQTDLAAGEGFEPPGRFPVQWFSSLQAGLMHLANVVLYSSFHRVTNPPFGFVLSEMIRFEEGGPQLVEG
jgi:hypothetical protein